MAWFWRHSFRIHVVRLLGKRTERESSLSFVDSFVTMRILKLFSVKKTQEDDASLVFLQTSVVSGALLVPEQCVTNRLCRETVSQEERVQAVVSDTNQRSEKCGWEVRLVEETQGERNWTWVLSNTQVKAITRGTKRLFQVVLRDQDTLSAQASKVNSDIKRSHRRRSGRRSGRAGVSTGRALLILKGVFGSTDTLRMWWTKLRVCLLRFDFVNNVCEVDCSLCTTRRDFCVA